VTGPHTTRHQKPYTRHPEPYTRHPELVSGSLTSHPESCLPKGRLVQDLPICHPELGSGYKFFKFYIFYITS